MNMGIPQLLLLVMYTLSLGIALAENGKKREVNVLHSVIAYAITLTLLVWGGFFN